MVTLKATPAAGWKFDHWVGTNGSKVTDNKIIMNSNKSVTAVFTENDYYGFSENAFWSYQISEKEETEGGTSNVVSGTIDMYIVDVIDYSEIIVFKQTIRVTVDGAGSQEVSGYIGKVETESGYKYYDVSIYDSDTREVIGYDVNYIEDNLIRFAPLTIGDDTDEGKVVAYEDINLFNRTFKAFKVDNSYVEEDLDYKYTYNYNLWIVPNIGIVKMSSSSTETSSYGTRTYTMNMELTSYSN